MTAAVLPRQLALEPAQASAEGEAAAPTAEAWAALTTAPDQAVAYTQTASRLLLEAEALEPHDPRGAAERRCAAIGLRGLAVKAARPKPKKRITAGKAKAAKQTWANAWVLLYVESYERDHGYTPGIVKTREAAAEADVAPRDMIDLAYRAARPLPEAE
jgi:hypothetical protein